ncbi:hypothetical protein V0288_14670 [Pannus brasiliensis CCIBt3594]|uniref:Uncharacterized protein n=1 Tax=Pannus brasiliensis CCIBt3594 TaxID=1427578 RepID=A0AAW9QU00_9CHRO
MLLTLTPIAAGGYPEFPRSLVSEPLSPVLALSRRSVSGPKAGYCKRVRYV